jgi:hypothetical protein
MLGQLHVTNISLLRNNGCCGRNLDLCQLIDKERILRKLRNEFGKLSAGHFWLLLAQGSHGQQNLRNRPKVPAMIGGDLELLDP